MLYAVVLHTTIPTPVSVLHNRVFDLIIHVQQITESQRTMLDRIEVLERKLKGLE